MCWAYMAGSSLSHLPTRCQPCLAILHLLHGQTELPPFGFAFTESKEVFPVQQHDIPREYLVMQQKTDESLLSSFRVEDHFQLLPLLWPES